MHIRVMTVVTNDDVTYVIKNDYTWEDSKPDSEVLHKFLCENDPGETYTVSFENTVEELEK